jgi:pimeloyl-ACP methyl ester carboxylesterase
MTVMRSYRPIMSFSTAAHSALRRVVSFPGGCDLPNGEYVELPGRGTTYASRIEGPPGAPTLFLIHALGCTANLTWFPSLSTLSQNYNLVLMDMRWHGRGIANGRFFRLTDCADDIAALADLWGIEQFIPVGYSMGGVIAQLVWRRHPEKVSGLVLCSTAAKWDDSRRERAFFTLLPTVTVPMAFRRRLPLPRTDLPMSISADAEDVEVRRWALAEFRSTRVASIIAALNAIGHFDSREWLGEVDVPTSVVVTDRDNWVPTRRQLAMAEAIPGADIFYCHRSHAACVIGAADFLPPLLNALDSVVARQQDAVA